MLPSIESRNTTTEPILSYGQQFGLISLPICTMIGTAIGLGFAFSVARRYTVSILLLFLVSLAGWTLNNSFGAALAKHSVVGTSVTENPEPTYAHKAQFSIKTLLLVTAIVALPVAGITCITQRRSAWQAEVKRRADQDVFTVKQIVIDVDAAYQTLGRAPKDQTELESVIGKSMPNVHDNGYPTPIHYMRTSETSYLLQYELWATDDWIYDSTKPQAGWVQHFY